MFIIADFSSPTTVIFINTRGVNIYLRLQKQPLGVFLEIGVLRFCLELLREHLRWRTVFVK